MKLSRYNEIIRKYREMKRMFCTDELCGIFPDVPKITMENIIFQEFQRKTRNTHFRHQQPDRRTLYYERYQESCKRLDRSGFLFRLAEEFDISPALMAWGILETHYNQALTDGDYISKNRINEMCKNTALIDDAKLAAEVHICILNDPYYGPISNVIHRTVGEDYEKMLKKTLTEMGIGYLDEKMLREERFDVTPDIKLDLPVSFNGHIVNWIESKASFGDMHRHKEYLKKQYWSYCNRFGPGLVIYWFGFIDEIGSHKDQGILVLDHLPKVFTPMDPHALASAS